MKVGDLVKVETKYEGKKLAVVIEPYYGTGMLEWVVKRLDSYDMTIADPCDLELVSKVCTKQPY